MSQLDRNKINYFLYDFSKGFLMKFRMGKGINTEQLNEFYSILEQLRNNWKGESLIEKDLVFELVSVVPALYRDLPIYMERTEYEDYKNIIYRLDTSISMCLNPNDNDPNFDIPLKELILV